MCARQTQSRNKIQKAIELNCSVRENLNNKDEQPDSTTVDKYDFTHIYYIILLQKAFDVSLNFNDREP